MNKYLLLLLLGLLAAQPAARAATDLTQAQVSAYVTVVKADRARDRGANAEALALYTDAMAQYHAIAEQDAKWHPDIVQFRVAYCQAEMDGLKGRPEGQPPPPAPEELAMDDSPVDVDTLERIIRLESENANLRAQQQALAGELELAQKALPAGAGEVAPAAAAVDGKLEQELRQCQEALEAARLELTRAASQPAGQPGAADPNLDQLKAEVEQLGEALKESARRLDASREMALDLLKPAPQAPQAEK